MRLEQNLGIDELAAGLGIAFRDDLLELFDLISEAAVDIAVETCDECTLQHDERGDERDGEQHDVPDDDAGSNRPQSRWSTPRHPLSLQLRAIRWRDVGGRDRLSDIESVRIDQWLHAVRLVKTRASAATACRGGHVDVNGKAAKPSTPVQVGDRVEALLNRRRRVVVVERTITKRVGAAVAVDCYADHSPPPPEREREPALFGQRDQGAGRPTKRDRRQIDRLRGRR